QGKTPGPGAPSGRGAPRRAALGPRRPRRTGSNPPRLGSRAVRCGRIDRVFDSLARGEEGRRAQTRSEIGMSAPRTVKVRAVDPGALWEEALAEAKPRGVEFTTISGHELEALYGPADARVDPEKDLGYPGQFPFTRGVHASMYRGRLWTMRQFAGFGSA